MALVLRHSSVFIHSKVDTMAEKLVVGLIGWRGMVGSVLMARMVEEGDFNHITPVFSQPVMQVAKRLTSA